MTTDDLIATLVRGLRPVTPLPAPSVRLRQWGLTALALLVTGVIGFGLRRDAGSALTEWRPLFDTAVLSLTAVLAAAAVLRLSIPGEQARWSRAPVVLVTAWMASLAVPVLASGWSPLDGGGLLRAAGEGGWWCAAQQVLIATTSGAVLLAMVARGMTIERAHVSLLTSLSAASVGALLSEWTCPSSSPPHLLLWHAGGSVVLMAIGMIVGSLCLGRLGDASRPIHTEARP